MIEFFCIQDTWIIIKLDEQTNIKEQAVSEVEDDLNVVCRLQWFNKKIGLREQPIHHLSTFQLYQTALASLMVWGSWNIAHETGNPITWIYFIAFEPTREYFAAETFHPKPHNIDRVFSVGELIEQREEILFSCIFCS